MNTSGQTATNMSVFGKSPETWTVDRIRDRLAPVVGGEWGDDPDAHDEGVLIPVIRVADIRGLDVTCEDLTIRRVKQSKLAGRLIGQRTLLIEKSGGGEQKPVGRAVLGRSLKFDAICSNFMAKTECHEGLSPLFAAYLLDSAYCCGINTAHIQQTTGIQNLRTTHYLNSKYAFPTLEGQQRIATYLDASCAAIDAALAVKQRQIETLETLLRSSIAGAVTRGLDPLVPMQGTNVPWIPETPKHWRVVRLKDVLEFFNTIRVPLSAAERGLMTDRTYAYYGASGIIDRVEAYLFDGTYILLAEDGANLLSRSRPLAFLASGKFWVNNHAHILRPRWQGDNTFFVHLLESQDFSPLVTGSAQPKLTQENLGRFKIAVPPFEEQRTIAAFIRQRKTAFDVVMSGIQKQVDTLAAYRKSLIHECVTGQRHVTEADRSRARSHG